MPAAVDARTGPSLPDHARTHARTQARERGRDDTQMQQQAGRQAHHMSPARPGRGQEEPMPCPAAAADPGTTRPPHRTAPCDPGVAACGAQIPPLLPTPIPAPPPPRARARARTFILLSRPARRHVLRARRRRFLHCTRERFDLRSGAARVRPLALALACASDTVGRSNGWDELAS